MVFASPFFEAALSGWSVALSNDCHAPGLILMIIAGQKQAVHRPFPPSSRYPNHPVCLSRIPTRPLTHLLQPRPSRKKIDQARRRAEPILQVPNLILIAPLKTSCSMACTRRPATARMKVLVLAKFIRVPLDGRVRPSQIAVGRGRGKASRRTKQIPGLSTEKEKTLCKSFKARVRVNPHQRRR